MNTSDLIATMERSIGPPPEWDPRDTDQEGQFNRWKAWSSKRSLMNDVRRILELQSVEDQARREISQSRSRKA